MKELLFSVTKKDFKITYFSGKGAGGQHRNKHMNCVRIKHPESGAMGVGQNHKSRKRNLEDALYNLAGQAKFRVWNTQRFYEILEGKKLEEKVDEMMSPENIKVEVKKDGKWICKKLKD